MPLIMIIEDDEQMRSLLQEMLEREGYEVLLAANGKEAMDRFGDKPVKLIITDILMPGMDGVEVITRLRRQKPTPAIVAISGGGAYLQAKDCIEWAKSLGVEHTFTKPFDRKVFLATVKGIMAR
ncbi:MAG: response regulator [Candidatus Lernaella stagnicola]|nr:response regulator [Candidatus Lernaella stagnicola]